MDSKTTEKIVRDWYTNMAAFNFGPVIETLADDLVFNLQPQPYSKMIPYLGLWKGKAAFGEASQIRNETSRITKLVLNDVVAQENKAVALITSSATCLATDISFDLKIVQWIELGDDGKIHKVDAIFDPVPEMNAFQPGCVTTFPAEGLKGSSGS